MTNDRPKTLFEKVWESHVVPGTGGDDFPSVLYVDLHLIHEVTSPQAFSEIRSRGLPVRRPERTVATMDHSTPTDPTITAERLKVLDPMGAAQLEQLAVNCADYGIRLYSMDSDERGIVHVIGPEQGLTQPGSTIVCGDSHTSTHGAFGALSFGIGTSEVGHVLATQCLLQHRPKTYEIRVDGRLSDGVTAKDIILHVIATLGVQGGVGHVFEYRGDTIEALDMEGRMTICNMSIEGGARAGMVAPDETTFAYLEGRPSAPSGAAWEAAVQTWKTLPTDDGAVFDQSLVVDAAEIQPMITFGTNPGMGMPVGGSVPTVESLPGAQRPTFHKALSYMGVEAGEPLTGKPIDIVFLGSCTNSRIADLRAAAGVLDGRRVASSVRMLVVPGSQKVKLQAEQEGLDEIFRAAGAEWREAGCSMCLAMNGDQLEPGQYAVSTSNRNFEGRQGPGGRTFLASPLTAAASAVAGSIADVRELL